jgi:hypothetical protein
MDQGRSERFLIFHKTWLSNCIMEASTFSRRVRIIVYFLTHIHDGFRRSLSETKVADLVVVLPGSFEGGQLQLRHGLETKSLDLAFHSGILTSIIAAYVGVWHSLSSVTSGYRLSLVYDINQPSTDTRVRRSLPETHGPALKLRHILRSWKQTQGATHRIRRHQNFWRASCDTITRLTRTRILIRRCFMVPTGSWSPN